MFIREVIPQSSVNHQWSQLRDECGDFLSETRGRYIYKLLPREYPDIKRVKVRHRGALLSTPTFNRLFEHVTSHMWERAVDTSTVVPAETDALEPFAVFMPDGFKHIQASPIAIREAIEVALTVNTSMDTICEAIVSRAISLTHSLSESLDSGSTNLIFYSVPSFYAVRLSHIQEL